MTRVLYRGTEEYLVATVSADVDLDMPVAFSFDRTTWHDATWVGSVGPTRQAQLLIGDTVPIPSGATPRLYIRLTDNPEAPVFSAGTFSVR